MAVSVGGGGSSGVGGLAEGGTGGAPLPTECTTGATRSCYNGPAGTQVHAPCKEGVQTCDESGHWGLSCEGEITPGEESCAPSSEADEDCDGEVNEGGVGCVCVPFTMQDCYEGPQGTAGVGICKAGEQVCTGDGTAWSNELCDGQALPADAETCDNLLDDNCDGNVDEGCECSPGDTRACYTGPFLTNGVGPCTGGTQTCGEDNKWPAACAGEVTPQSDVCGDGIDNNCDNNVDDGFETGVPGCACVPFTKGACYEGPLGTLNVGTCKAGGRTCAADGTAWGPCEGDVTPTAQETCDDQIDNDCDGKLYNACPLRGLSAGGSHACAIRPDGALLCWGQNDDGQLGIGGVSQKTKAAQVTGLTSGVVSVSAGWAHTCAVLSSGALKCWGANTFGQLGDGTVKGRTKPVAVVGLETGVQAVAAATTHTCAVLVDGSVKCWGDQSSGRLGNGESTDAKILSPTNVATLSAGTVEYIDAGASHTCVILTGGTVQCWGANWDGVLGTGDEEARPVPTDVVGLSPSDGSPATRVSAGSNHTCAVLASKHQTVCWGKNHRFQLGDFTTTTRLTPVPVVELHSEAVDVTVSSSSTCALLDTGSVDCWGDGSFGQIGEGIVSLFRALPTATKLATPQVAISSLGPFICSAKSTGGAMCWGNNETGQAGNGTTTSPVALPTEVLGLDLP